MTVTKCQSLHGTFKALLIMPCFCTEVPEWTVYTSSAAPSVLRSRGRVRPMFDQSHQCKPEAHSWFTIGNGVPGKGMPQIPARGQRAAPYQTAFLSAGQTQTGASSARV